jgi:hypothetical protein
VSKLLFAVRQEVAIRARLHWSLMTYRLRRYRSRNWYKECPWWQAQNGGPRDLPGAFGPGTCMGGCWDEPVCQTSPEVD